MAKRKARLTGRQVVWTQTGAFPDTHMVAMGHFSIFYKFNSKEVIITAFWDNRKSKKTSRRIKKN